MKLHNIWTPLSTVEKGALEQQSNARTERWGAEHSGEGVDGDSGGCPADQGLGGRWD